MSKDYTNKIRILLKQSKQTVPYIFQRFYTVLKKVSISLNHYDSDPKIFQQFALIYKTVKKYIKDEPESLLNNMEKINKDLKHLITPFNIFIKDDSLSKNMTNFFLNQEACLEVKAFIEHSAKIIQDLQAKQLKIKVFGSHQLANAFWVNKFRSQFAVHFDAFWSALLEFTSDIPYFSLYISQYSRKTIRKKIDPEKKYYVTSSNVTQLFYKLSEPYFLQKLADETAKGQKVVEFTSKDFLQIQFLRKTGSTFETNLSDNKTFQINGQDIQVQGKIKKVKFPPTVQFGSATDADIRIKNKYVSRKQFMIIEQEEQQTNISLHVLPPSGNLVTLPFSLVCLSSSNFTMVSYTKKSFLLKVGTIFKVGDSSIQVLRISNKYVDSNNINNDVRSNLNSDNSVKNIIQCNINSSAVVAAASEPQQKSCSPGCDNKKQQQNIINDNIDDDSNVDDDDQTLEYLPKKVTPNVSQKRELQYIVLSGQEKGKKGILDYSSSLSLSFDESTVTLEYDSKNNQFYLPADTSIYVKTANQIVNGQISHKVLLQEHMNIILEQCRFSIK